MSATSLQDSITLACSSEIALKNIWLQPSGRWGHTEYSFEYHKDYLARHTGLADDSPERLRLGYERFAFDFIWHTQDGLIDWSKAGRTTDMGHASYAIDASDKRQPRRCPFTTEEEVWDFDAVEEYGLPDFGVQVRAYETILEMARTAFPNQLTTGGYYKTIVSGAIEAFGWEMLLLAAADASRMEKVFDSFFRRTLFHMQAWAQTSAEVIIQHDDFVWTRGAFMRPDIYRSVIIPRYAELWKPLHAAGKKVLFCSDGNFMQFAGDIVAAGADGLIFEPCNHFDFMVDNFGQTTCLVGSFVDCRDLASGKWEKVQADIDRTIARLDRCNGAIVAIGNHMPPDISGHMVDRYFEYLLPRLAR